MNNRSSFFDDDDLNIKFDWERLERTSFKDILSQKPFIQGTFARTQANSKTNVSGYFSLFQRCIVQFKDHTTKQTEGVLDISNSRLKIIQGGFSLTKNGNTYDFTSKDESLVKNWTDLLRGICVLTTFHEEYKAIKMIGRGSFAKVYLVDYKNTSKSYAAKAFTKESIIISNKNNAKSSIINEIDIMRCISHENIIQLYEVHESEKSIYLVLELIQGKALQDVLKKPSFKNTYSEVKIINMIRSILDALAYLSEKGIMHRDLKPDNILLDKNDKIKVVDFGLATFVNLDTYIFKKCGTPGYIAPEVFKYDEKNPSTNYDDRCDVFSAGCILFYMLFGYPFFDGSDGSEILKMNRKFTNEFESISKVKQELKNPCSKISKEGLNLLLELLEFDQKRRNRAEYALKHPFFTPIPSDMKASTTDDYSKYIDSPKSKGSNSGDFQQMALLARQNSTSNKEKYEQKDSLYIDVGQPLLNGRTDTLSAGVGSNNNSLLLAQTPSNHNSNPNSLSKFAKGGKTGGGSDLRKAAILKNLQANDSDIESPRADSRDRSNSLGDRTRTSNTKERSPDNIEDISYENSQVQKNFEKVTMATPDKHPSKLLSSVKRYSLLENRSAGNSPKGVGVKNGIFQSRFGEETKSPR